MDLDEEIFQRLTNTEDHFTERKTSPHRDQCTEAMVAFANSAILNKPGILYVGVTDDGRVVGGENVASWQIKLTGWANGCSPEVPIIPRVLNKDGKEFLAVVVPLSQGRPHFARPAFKRLGAMTIAANQSEIDQWIAYRDSKVRHILEHKGQTVTLQPIKSDPQQGRMKGGGSYRLIDCNAHWVTLESTTNNRIVTHPLNLINLKMNEEKPNPPGELLLLLTPYYH